MNNRLRYLTILTRRIAAFYDYIMEIINPESARM